MYEISNFRNGVSRLVDKLDRKISISAIPRPDHRSSDLLPIQHNTQGGTRDATEKERATLRDKDREDVPLFLVMRFLILFNNSERSIENLLIINFPSTTSTLLNSRLKVETSDNFHV